MKTSIYSVTIEIDTDKLTSYTDEHLSSLWHVAQANTAPITDYPAAQLAEAIGREIICRWLKNTTPTLYHHQGKHPYWAEMSTHGKWHDGKWKPGSDDNLATLIAAVEAFSNALPDPSREICAALDDALADAKAGRQP